MNTLVINETDFKYQVINKLDKIKKLTDSGDLLIGGHLINDPVQKILVNFENDGWFGSTFLPLIESSAIDSERKAPGSGRIFLNLVTALLAEDIRNSLIGFDQESTHDTKIDLTRKSLKFSSSGLCSKKDFDTFINNNLSDQGRRIIEEGLSSYSLGDQVFVKKSLIRETCIKRIEGYNFDNIIPNKFFLRTGEWSRSNVNVVIVDGIIESIGEIHHLLEKAATNQEPYLIVCTGILPEPLSTIQNNFNRKTIDVIVAQIKSDEFSIQSIVDLGTVCLCDPISALKGDTISQATTRGIVKVEKVLATDMGINIINSASRTAVDKLLDDVLKRTQENPDVAYLFQNRVKSLSSSKVEIFIGRDDADIQKNIVEEVDLFFRSCPHILRSGFTKKSELTGLPEELLCLLFGKTDVQPTYRIEKPLELFDSIRTQIVKTGKIITSDTE
jgi:hypothetical protein